MKEENSKKNKTIFPFRMLGLVLSGLSILNLVEDLSPIKIYGKLKVWIEAYSVFVTNFFRWIDFEWLSISSNESHLLVIAAVIGAAWGRAEKQFKSEKGESSTWIDSLLTSFHLFGPVFLIALIFPGSWGFWTSIIFLGPMIAALYLVKTEIDAPRKSVLRETIWVLVVFSMIVVLNYAVFRG